jgi:Asp/Glu/hydantoin racemase
VYFTAESGPKSINDEDDAAESLTHCKPALQQLISGGEYKGYVVACYSQHPMVPWLKEQLPATSASTNGVRITGIFEASVGTALQLLGPGESFGIVSTGKVWEQLLTDAVTDFLGVSGSPKFAGVETTGLNATELHDAPPEIVRLKMKEATKRLLARGKVGAICLGCAGMAGMNEMVREAAVEALGETGKDVRIVDGVVSAAAWVEGAIRMSV